ncbi:MAG: TonB-dependent receptor, partial [Verrucomicrobiota bacterium]
PAQATGQAWRGGTNRMVGLDQVSINNISRFEVNFSPTPESQGMALAGSVNMIPRSSFERSRPQFNFSSYVMMRDNAKNWNRTPAPRHPTRKVHPGSDFSYINPVSKNFGFTLSAGFNRQYSGEPQAQMFWRGTQQPTNGVAFPHTTYDQPYLTSFVVRNSGKDTKRSSFGVTADYRLTQHDRFTFSFQASTFDVAINHNALTFSIDRINPGDFTTTSSRSAPGMGSIQMVTTGADRANWTYMPSLIWRHDGPIWKMESGYSYSRARNRNRTLESGFFDTATVRRTGLNVAFSDIFYLRPRVITVTDAAGAAVDPYSLSSYYLTTATDNTRGTDDTKRTAYANIRRDFFGAIPLSLKSGLDFRQAARDQRANNPGYTFFGPDNVATNFTTASDDRPGPFIDPSFSSRVAPYGFPKIESISNELLYQYWQANPNQVRLTNANNAYRAPINLSKRAEELVSSAYIRGDLQFFQNRMKVVGGVRVEQTNIEAEGPLTDPTRNYQRDAQGNPVLGANGRPLLLVPATNALGVSQLTFIDRGAQSEKEYLRWFPSLNVSYNLRENLILRGAYSTSIGRPDYNQYAGGVIIPDIEALDAGTPITVSNVSIKPWRARSFTAGLEYYFQGVGKIGVSAFRRDIEDFFGSVTFLPPASFYAENGLDPATYGMYEVTTQHNVDDTVRMQGIKVDYKQSLTFLPPWARGVSVFANATAQRLLGPATSNFDGFVPRTANWGVNLNRGRYALRMNWNYRGNQRRLAIANPGPATSIEPGTFTYWSKRLYVDVNAEYTFYKRFAAFAALRNIGDTPDDVQVYGPSTPQESQFRQRVEFGSLWTFGIKGTF